MGPRYPNSKAREAVAKLYIHYSYLKLNKSRTALAKMDMSMNMIITAGNSNNNDSSFIVGVTSIKLRRQ